MEYIKLIIGGIRVLYLRLSWCFGVIYPGRLPGEGKEEGIHSIGKSPSVKQSKFYLLSSRPHVADKVRHKHLSRACVASNTLLGSAGGGSWADLPWKLSLRPLPVTTFL